MKMLLLILSILNFSQNVFAGEVGNGGDVVVCAGSKPILLDYYELENIRNRKVSLAGAEWLSKVQFVFNRIRRIDSERADLYANWFKSFLNESRFFNNSELRDVPDSKHVVLPKGCRIEQLVVQTEPRFDEDVRYSFDSNLWNQMTEDQKAGAVLHELFYREAISINHTDSIGARYLNGLFATHESETITLDQYIVEVANAGYTWFTYGPGHRIRPSITNDKIQYFDGTKRIRYAREALIKMDDGSFLKVNDAYFFESGGFKFSSRIELFTHFLHRMHGAQNPVLMAPVFLRRETKPNTFKPWHALQMNELGEVIEGVAVGPMHYLKDNVEIKVEKAGHIYFNFTEPSKPVFSVSKSARDNSDHFQHFDGWFFWKGLKFPVTQELGWNGDDFALSFKEQTVDLKVNKHLLLDYVVSQVQKNKLYAGIFYKADLSNLLCKDEHGTVRRLQLKEYYRALELDLDGYVIGGQRKANWMDFHYYTKHLKCRGKKVN